MEYIERIIRTIDKGTIEHSEKVGSILKSLFSYIEEEMIADRKAINRERFLNSLRVGGIVHDVGKAGVDKGILCKKGRLTLEEYEEVKKHPIYGGNIVYGMRIDYGMCKDTLINAAKFHHERWDGTGYPFGLKGKEIPIEARIISVIDTYEAIRAVRPYSEAKTHGYAINEIMRCAGTQFDDNVVDLFIRREKLVETVYADCVERGIDIEGRWGLVV